MLLKNPQYLNLHAWLLGENSCKNKISLWKEQRELLSRKGHQQQLYLKSGVETTRWTSPHLLGNRCQTFMYLLQDLNRNYLVGSSDSPVFIEMHPRVTEIYLN